MSTDRDLEEHSIKQGTSHQAVISCGRPEVSGHLFAFCLVGCSLRILRAARLHFKASSRVLISFTALN